MISPSLFYMERYGYRYPVSLLAVEVYSIASEKAGQDDQALYDSLVTTVTQVCKVSDPKEEDLRYFVSRLEKIRDNIKKEESETPKKPKKPVKSFGTSYLEYLQGLSIDAVILKMTNYNIDSASKLYCELDMDDVKALVDQYVTGQSEQNLIFMEGPMYGFGSSYEGDSKSSNESSYDLSSPEGIGALRGLGF